MRIHLSVPVSPVFGAGTCGKYLLREFAKRGEVHYSPIGESGQMDDETQALVNHNLSHLTADVPYPLIQFVGPNLEQVTKFRGSPNVGIIFSEWEPITEAQKQNLKAFDILIAGSEWNAEVIRKAGFDCHAIPQGVDRDVFNPKERGALKDRFVIFSGGKYEHRKAQDLVIRAVKILQERHSDILLMTAWFNIFTEKQVTTSEVSAIHLPLCGQEELASHMNNTDIGLFPNRVEGGTNLVMMEYLACGKPVVARDENGQADVLKETYASYVNGSDDEVVEQMVKSVEHLYQNRELLKAMGDAADLAMDAWSWSRMAEGILKAIKEFECVTA